MVGRKRYILYIFFYSNVYVQEVDARIVYHSIVTRIASIDSGKRRMSEKRKKKKIYEKKKMTTIVLGENVIARTA